jgi:hypothetical protein
MKHLLITFVLVSHAAHAAPPGPPASLSDVEQQRTLAALTPLKPLEVLDQLAQLRQRAAKGQPAKVPAITVYLRSGRELSGRVLALSAPEAGERTLLLEAAEGTGAAATVAGVYVPLSSIEAVRVHEVASVAREAGLMRPIPAVTRLEVEREASDTSRAVGEVIGRKVTFDVQWKTLPDSTESRRTVLEALRAAALALQTLAQDDAGKTALAQRLRHVSIVEASKAEVALSGDTLTLRIDSRAGDHPNAEAVRQQLEKDL